MGSLEAPSSPGPIMALYSSPGPKYLIPPTTAGKPLGLWEGGAGEAEARSGVGLRWAWAPLTPSPSATLGSVGGWGEAQGLVPGSESLPHRLCGSSPTKLLCTSLQLRGGSHAPGRELLPRAPLRA